MLVRRAALFAVIAVVACGSRGAAHRTTADPHHPSVMPPLPSLAYAGGRVIEHPAVVTVTFDDDDDRSRVEEFGSTLTHGAWWRKVTAGMCPKPAECIGAGPEGTSARLAYRARPKVSIESVGGILVDAITRGALEPPNDQTIYLVYLPRGVAFDKGKSCVFGGARAHHATFLQGGKPHPYAAILRCDDGDETLATAAHEALEMASDPELGGFHLDAESPFALFGTKAIDPCTVATLDTHRVFLDGHVFQRAWSNSEAAAGHDPCIPHAPDAAYFGAVPSERVIELGKEKPHATVAWTAFSDRPVPDWAVSVVEIGRLADGVRCLDVDLDTHEVNNGTSFKSEITLGVPACPHALAVGLVSTLGARSHVWPLVIHEDTTVNR